MKILWGVLFISLLSSVNQDQVKVVGHEPIQAKVGDDVILPCHLEPPFDVNKLTIEWRFQRLHSNGSDSSVIFLHRSGDKDNEASNPNFKDRTSLFNDEFKNGNISLKLTNVTKKDEGNYTCFVPKLESQVKKGKVTLKVDENRPEGKLTDPGGPDPGVIGVVVVFAVAFIIIIIIYFFKRRRRGQPSFSCLGNNSQREQGRNDGDRRRRDPGEEEEEEEEAVRLQNLEQPN